MKKADWSARQAQKKKVYFLKKWTEKYEEKKRIKKAIRFLLV